MAASCEDGELAATAVDRLGNAAATVDATAVVVGGEGDVVAKTGQENWPRNAVEGEEETAFG